MNRRPNRPFFCFLLDIDQQTHFFRPTGPWGVELPGWGPCTSHPTGRVACRGMPWEEMADMEKLIPRYSKHFPRTEWLSDCWFYWCLDFHRNGRMITTINKPHSFRGSPWNQVRYCVYLRIFRMMIWTSPGGLSDVRACGALTQSASKWSAPKHLQLGGCIDAQFLRPYCTHIASYRYHNHETTESTPLDQLTSSMFQPWKPKKNSKKGGNGWWFPYVSLIGWLVNVFKSLLNGRSQDRLRFRHHRLRERYPVQMGGVSRKMGEWE